jgi:competence ComEA-like helix-hairpin-helix protein
MKIFTKVERNIVVFLSGIFLLGLLISAIKGKFFNNKNDGLTLVAKDEEVAKIISSNNSNTDEIYHKIDINSADIDLLVTLKGVGPKTAEKIIEKREKLGGFNKIEDILQVSGIGQKTFDKFSDYIIVNKQ